MSNKEPIALTSSSSGTECVVCGGAAFQKWRRAPDQIMGGWVRYAAVRCTRCGLRRLQPRPGPEAMAAAYNATYARAEGEEETAGLGQRLDEFFERQADRAMDAYGGRPKGKLLDIGCGDGRFLASMQKRGWQLEGIETDSVAADLARRRSGGTVHETPLEETELTPGTYQMVSLLHVLEHVPNPRETLTIAARLLAPGGMLLLALPNAGSWESHIFGTCWYPLDLPRHYWGFTPPTLVRLTEECGFNVSNLNYFPFLFVLQSLRYAMRALSGRPATPPDPAAAKSEAGGLRTKIFLSLLDVSGKVGKSFPGEIMELTAFKPEQPD